MGDNREGLLTGEDEIRGAQRILLHTNLTNKIIQLLANVAIKRTCTKPSNMNQTIPT